MTINGALVLKALRASNGIIYIIDRVLDPKDLAFKNTQMEVLRSNKDFSIIYRLFEDLGITLISDRCKFIFLLFYNLLRNSSSIFLF